MNVYLEAQGCRVNEAERAGWLRELLARGHRVVADPEAAQVVVLNTCAVTQESARKARRRLTRLRRGHPRALLVATGCWATLEPDAADAADLLVSNLEKQTVVDRLEELEPPPRALEAEPIAAAPRTRAFVKVQDGCRNRCTFCVVTIARGDERSRPVAQVVEEIQALRREGVQEVVLTGIHLGGYGGELGTDLTALVRAVLQQTDIPRLRLSSLEPWDLPPDFFSLWEDGRLCPHLHLPLQSGSDAVLRRMARRTTRASFAHLIADARAAIPDLSFTTDVIAGFPGESPDDARQTHELLEALAPADLHVFTYSPRAGTVAARLPDPLPQPTRQERARELRHLADRLRHQAQTAALGHVRPVLWERRPRPHEASRLTWRGHTDTYLRVTTHTDINARLGNRITPTRLVALDDHALTGDVATAHLPLTERERGRTVET